MRYEMRVKCDGSRAMDNPPYPCAMSLSEALARSGEQARAVFHHVRAQRQIASVTIERSVELFMVLEGIDMAEFDKILHAYNRTAKTARENGYEEKHCKTCPEA